MNRKLIKQRTKLFNLALTVMFISYLNDAEKKFKPQGGLSTSPFGKLRLSKNNQIVKSPFEKDYT